MTARPFTPTQFAESVRSFLDAHVGIVHREDVGPLLGQAAVLAREGPFDPSMRRHWPEALCAALAPFEREARAPAVRWTHVDGAPADPRRTPVSALAAGVHAAMRASVRNRRAGR